MTSHVPNPLEPERYAPQHPVVDRVPERPAPPNANCCGGCPYWNAHRILPFGQCLIALKALGQPMYTSDLSGCSLTEDQKVKYKP